jgi:hypothetical protein
MRQIAMSWLIFQMTQSSFQLSVVLLANHIRALFLSPLAGALADRWNRPHVLLLTQNRRAGSHHSRHLFWRPLLV